MVWWIVVCMFCVVMLMLWFIENCRMIVDRLAEELEVMIFSLEICLNWCFSGVVIREVIVVVLVFGYWVVIIRLGVLIFGSVDIGNWW